MHLNDIEEHFILIGFEGIDLDMFKLFLLFYADDIVIMSETEEGLNLGLFLLENYCDRWKLTVNATNTKVMILRKGGRENRNIRCIYKWNVINEIVSKFTYIGIVFTTGGSLNTTLEMLARGRSRIFKKTNDVQLLSVLRGHSFFSLPPQRPLTSDLGGFSIPDFIHYIFFIS